jgi:deazaflavin-dependent oxidoreductase (nitroreductase family)
VSGRIRRSILITVALLLGVLVVAGVTIARDPLRPYQWLYETTDGRFTWLGGLPVLLLRTTGRKTGEERTAALVYLQDGNTFVVVASRGGSDRPPRWLLNLQAHPEVGVQIGRQRQRMRARVADSQERARLWPLINQNNSNRYDGYQAKTKREIPVVILSPF